MTFTLRRSSGEDLALTEEHELLVRPRRGEVHFEAFDPAGYDAHALDDAALLWRTRAVQELHSLTLFTELAAHVQLLGAPLDWSGAFARMIADEVRHTDLCMRMCEAFGRPAAPEVDADALHHEVAGASLREHVRQMLVAAFCIGETLSGRMFRRALRAATVPLAREVVSAILVDETFHGEFGWEAGALLMREADPGERDRLAGELPGLFAHFARLCLATRGPEWARGEPEAQPEPNFGTLTDAGYARAFFDGMEEDVVPGLVAIGLPEAEPAYRTLLASFSSPSPGSGERGGG